jgi:hypothetical protein
MKQLRQLIRLPFEILRTLQAIERRLESLENTGKSVDACIDNRNHRSRYRFVTGHWND